MSYDRSFNRGVYPNIAFVCDVMDAQVRVDPVDIEQEPIPVIFCVGSYGEPSAGLFAFEATPSFGSPEELEEFCRVNRAKYEEYAEMETLPQRLFWEGSDAS